MKNVHILPTDKPSRLSDCHNNKLHLDDVRYLRNYQNIYITSNEEIKEGDWIYNIVQKTIFKADKSFLKLIGGTLLTNQKIILTTDQDLIKDGVQAIDDEFLEWFVKNQSCEEVEVKHIIKEYIDELDAFGYNVDKYKIIIPKQEQVLIQSSIDGDVIWSDKQETLEEALSEYIKDIKYPTLIQCAEFGAKWQQKRMYSQEEVLEILKMDRNSIMEVNPIDIIYLDKCFNQFKKK
jgi:hypothetical protein